MLALMIWLWIRRSWSLPARLGYTLSTLTLLGFSAWLAWLAVPLPTDILG